MTITLDDETAAWARVNAARDDKSLSRFLSDLLQSSMRDAQVYGNAMTQYLSKRPIPLSRDGETSYPTRDDLYDR